MYDPLGLSIGTTNLVAACNGSPPISRRAVLTLYPHCAPKVGVTEENPNSIGDGVLMGDFVERIGDSVTLVSPDGAAHDPDLLMVEALDAMVAVVGADASSSDISIAVPAQWKPDTVQAFRNGLRTHVGFVRSGMAPRLVSDAIAALTAVNSELGVPVGGVVGLLDFGASGTSITLIETRSDFKPVSATLRCEGFSGNEIDQSLLLYVLERIGYSGDIDLVDTTAIGQLSRVKEQCREVKERLSTDTVTELAVELPECSSKCSSNIQVTREQLEGLIQDRLTGFIYAFEDMLARNNTSFANLAAVVTTGGGASIPIVAQRLSFHTRRPVLAASQPAFSAAIGALLLASRGKEQDLRTRTSIDLLAAAAAGSGTATIELPRGDVMVIDQDALTDRELAWSQTEYPGDVPVRFEGDSYNEDGPCWSMHLNLIEPSKNPPWRRVRMSQLLIGLCAVVAMIAIGGVAFTLTSVERRQAPVMPTIAPLPAPSRSMVPSSLAPSPVPPPPTATPIPSAESVPTSEAPPSPPTSAVTTRKAPPTTTTTLPPKTTTTTPTSAMTTPSSTAIMEPEPTSTLSTSSTTVSMTTTWLHVPLIPVPIPVLVPVNQAPQNPFLTPDTP